MKWRRYLKQQEWDKVHREDYYLAAIAFQIARANSANPKALKSEDFLIKFKEKKEEEAPKKMDQETLDKRTAASKAGWGGILAAAKPRTPPKALERGKQPAPEVSKPSQGKDKGT